MAVMSVTRGMYGLSRWQNGDGKRIRWRNSIAPPSLEREPWGIAGLRRTRLFKKLVLRDGILRK